MGKHKSKPGNGSKNDQAQGKQKAKLCIGVETEAPLTVTKWNEDTKQHDLLDGGRALRELARLFNSIGLHAYASALDTERDHSKWGITIDTSIEVGNELEGIGTPIEIKSPPMTIDLLSYMDMFRAMWGIIEPLKVPSIEYWKLASTHIHFSLEGLPSFPMDLAQKLAFCIVYFEKPIDELIPTMTDASDRKRPGGWRYCTRRNHNIELKYWKWNFKGLNYKTIEFRHMPPARSAQETLDWITFTSDFVAATAKVDRVRLDMAADRQISFTEALGFSLGDPREEQ
ncbi:hypothetical protein F4824DRAFT_505581 [Ustulina deusta]|nr:hypothetical protein F4824DRAFT_505581 [Ustulina deusta]